MYLPDQEKNEKMVKVLDQNVVYDGDNADKTVVFEIESSSLWRQCVWPSGQSLPDRENQGKHKC